MNVGEYTALQAHAIVPKNGLGPINACFLAKRQLSGKFQTAECFDDIVCS